ncbi:hypothetical protein KAT63_05105 [Candidatus Parcubacteria bacterium]|nr:hypothetical protein [Candidatus Parcubacteria bacterium]
MSEEQIENLKTTENQVEIKDSKRKVLVKLVVLLSVILIIGIYIFSSKQNAKLEIEDAINLGRTYSYSLLESYWFTLDGKQQELTEISTDKAKEKIEN